MSNNRINDFAAAADWADDIKEEGITMFDNWHFINQPVNPNGVFVDIPDQPSNNVIFGINKTVKALKNQATAGKNTIEKAFMLRLLLHFLGDIHQPLHNTVFVNETLLSGD